MSRTTSGRVRLSRSGSPRRSRGCSRESLAAVLGLAQLLPVDQHAPGAVQDRDAVVEDAAENVGHRLAHVVTLVAARPPGSLGVLVTRSPSRHKSHRVLKANSRASAPSARHTSRCGTGRARRETRARSATRAANCDRDCRTSARASRTFSPCSAPSAISVGIAACGARSLERPPAELRIGLRLSPGDDQDRTTPAFGSRAHQHLPGGRECRHQGSSAIICRAASSSHPSSSSVCGIRR